MALIPQQVTGKKLGGYELTKEAFASGVGATYVAKGPSGGTVLVTKIHRHVAKSPQLVDAFLAEAKAARAIVHPSVAAIVDHGVIDGEPFVAYEHTDGETLASLLRKVGPEGIPLSIAARIVEGVLDAVTHAADTGSGLSHGELGPWCVHVGVDGQTRVTGFAVDRALVRFGLHYAKNLERLTYASPERVKPMSLTLGPPPPAPDLRSDTFSACVLAWELLTRQRLFASRKEAAIIQKVLTGPIAEAKSVRAEIGGSVSDMIATGLSRDPAARPQPSAVGLVLSDLAQASPADIGRFVEDSRGRSPTAGRSESIRPGIGFNRSVTPKSFAAVKAETAGTQNGRVQNGDASPPAAPVRPAAGLGETAAAKKRASTLIGFTPGTATPKVPVIEEDATVDTKAVIPAAAPSSTDATNLIEEISTSDGDFRVEVDVPTAPIAAKPATSAPPPAPRRGPPPKPRQVTLMGIEPLVGTPGMDAPPGPALALTPTPAPAVTKPSGGIAANIGSRNDALRSGGVVSTAGGSRYELLSAVARGGMAVVWAARPFASKGLEKLNAVKTMLPEICDDLDFEKMFLDEMRVAAKIKHPNVAEILEVGESDDIMYLVMEWVEGETLGAVQEAARTSGGIPTNVLLRIAAEACAGLHAAHELRDDSGQLLDLVHRDINPTNVLLDVEGHVKVLDFGIAKSKGRLHVTRAGSTVKGKTPYLSPEQLGGMSLDRRSDLFSLGALFYVLATGLHPFRSENDLQTLENIALKAPDSPKTLSPDLPADLDKLILRLLEKDPRKRFSSAAEVEKEIERIEASLPKAASNADVAAFLQRVCGPTIATRRAAIVDAVRSLDGTAPASAEAPTAAAPTVQVRTASPLVNGGGDLFGTDEPTIDEGAAGVAEPVEPIGFSPTLSEAGSVSDPIPAEVPESYADEPAPSREPSSQWTRLGMLIAVGVGVGIAIILLIESMRGDEKPTTAPSAKPTVTAVATTAAAPPTPAPTPTPTPVE
ncbi:MAG: protein kinase, partial [Polyangiaceae bacterium]|nr:protein kinase [Polyangiaceae bacterium]